MIPRKPLLVRVWRKVFPAKPLPPAPIKLSSVDPNAQKPVRKPIRSSIEPLEGRIAPAALLPGGKILKYKDSDGDDVTITFSKNLFSGESGATLHNALDGIFTFSTGNADDSPTAWQAHPQQLQLINLTSLATSLGNVAEGLSFTVGVQKDTAANSGSDGEANIGGINATGLALGSVTIHGDLGYINVGKSGVPTALKSLDLASLGARTDTQVGANPSYTSTITGALGSFHAGFVEGAYLNVTTATGANSVGRIGSIVIDHSLSARSLIAGIGVPPEDDGLIQAAFKIGSIKIGSGHLSAAGGVSDGLIGGWGPSSGAITAGSSIGQITIDGVVSGAAGVSSGSIQTSGLLGNLHITGDIIGGGGQKSGSITAYSMANVNIDGSISGGAGASSAAVISTVNIGNVAILGSVAGGDGSQSASIQAAGTIGAVRIGSAAHPGLHGGAGDSSGSISSTESIGQIAIIGDITGGAPLVGASAAPVTGSSAQYSGSISSGGTLAGIRVSGSLDGGGGMGSGSIDSDAGIGSITILGSVRGGAGASSGTVNSAESLSSITVGGSLDSSLASSGQNSGSIFAASSGKGKLGSVLIGSGASGGELIGGDGATSAAIVSGNAIGTIAIRGISAGSGVNKTSVALSGGTGAYSGSIYASGAISSIVLAGDLSGSAGDYSASITAHGSLGSVNLGNATGGNGSHSASINSLDSADFTKAGSIGKITGGIFSLAANATGVNAAQIDANGNIGSIKLVDLRASAVSGTGAILSGTGTVSDGSVGALQLSSLEGTLQIGASLASLTVATSINGASVHIGTALGSLVVHGSVTGATFTADGNVLSAKKTDTAFGEISIGANVMNTQFLAGYDINGAPSDGSAQIGSVSIGGNWQASNLVAGVSPGADGKYGTADDVLVQPATQSIVSKIASVVIRGAVLKDSSSSTTHFGFVANAIGAFEIGAAPVQLVNGVAELTHASADTNATVREVSLT